MVSTVVTNLIHIRSSKIGGEIRPTPKCREKAVESSGGLKFAFKPLLAPQL